jgi:predicted cation transporter
LKFYFLADYLGVLIGFLVVFLAVLLGSFKIHVIEENLEAFLFVCGVLAMTLSGFAVIPGVETGWSM